MQQRAQTQTRAATWSPSNIHENETSHVCMRCVCVDRWFVSCCQTGMQTLKLEITAGGDQCSTCPHR